MRINAERGFTLIEVMITVAIVAILAAVAYPSYLDQIAKGKRSECRSGALQTMQQEERYFGQYNTYIAASAPPAVAKVKNFSGDNLTGSACTITAAACTGQTVAQCIEVRSTPQYSDPKKIEYLYADSNGVRGCSIGGTRSTTEKACW